MISKDQKIIEAESILSTKASSQKDEMSPMEIKGS